MKILNNRGISNHDFLFLALFLVVMIVFVVIVYPKVTQAQEDISSSRACILQTVSPSLCTITQGSATTPWSAKVWIAESGQSAENEIVALRVTVGDASTDLKKEDLQLQSLNVAPVQIDVSGNSTTSEVQTQAKVDTIYQLKSGSTVFCHSLPLSCNKS